MNLGILASALLAFSGGPASPASSQHPYIVGGTESAPGAHPAVVAVVVQRQLCAATVLTPHLLVTAAHCFSSATSDTRVSVHLENSLNEGMILSSKDWATHPDYCGREDCKDESYDYAYIKVEEPIELNRYPRPITSQTEYDQVMQPGQPLLLVGYGEDETGTSSLGQKREVSTSISMFTPKGRQFLTSGQGKDSCRGDSGGPALGFDNNRDPLWLGVLSSGSRECGKGGYYGVPLPILGWLKQQTGYDPGGCLSESCLQLTQPAGGTQDPDDPPEGSCAARVGDSPRWGWSLLLLAGLGRLRRTRTHAARA